MSDESLSLSASWELMAMEEREVVAGWRSRPSSAS